MDLLSAVVTLFLVMDSLGNVPLFMSLLKTVEPRRRRIVLVREIVVAYLVLVMFLVLGDSLLRFLGLGTEAVGIAGGIVLFLIALRMVFPSYGSASGSDALDGEPFIVPLAIPLVAGPSTIATLLLLQNKVPSRGLLLVALTIAWALTGVILLSSTFLYRLLGERGLQEMERLMGMLLVMVAVQMLLNGIRTFLVLR